MVSIIIRAKDGQSLTAACIRSIRKNTPRDQYRLIVVQSGRDVYRADRSLSSHDVFIHSPKPIGAVTATNIGLGTAFQLGDPYIAIMDNDTRVPDGDSTWLERFVGELEQGGESVACVGATSAKVNVPQHILAAPQTYTADWEDKDQSRGGVKDNPQAMWFVSFCVLFHARVLEELGMWDTRYDPGNYEDTDYAVQVREAGYEIRVARSVYIHHDCHATFGDQMTELMKTNGAKFTLKWGPGRLWDMGILPDATVVGMLRAKAGM